METDQRMEDQEIWKCSFALACFIYSVTDRDSFCLDIDLRKKVRKLMVRILSSIIESFETGNPREAGEFLRQAVVSLRDLKQTLISAYQCGCLNFQEFSKVRAECGKLSSMLLAPEMDNRGVGTG